MDFYHERIIDGRRRLYCPIEEKLLAPYEDGRRGDTAFWDRDRPGRAPNACNLCSDDKRSTGERLRDLEDARRSEEETS